MRITPVDTTIRNHEIHLQEREVLALVKELQDMESILESILQERRNPSPTTLVRERFPMLTSLHEGLGKRNTINPGQYLVREPLRGAKKKDS